MGINTQFFMFEDTPSGKDPDKYSPTLRQYHQLLWSKPLPSGTEFKLQDEPGGYIYHISEVGEFRLSSDAITNTHSHVGKMAPITSQISKHEMGEFYNLGSTIGGYIVFPRKMVDKKQNINQARGCNVKIRDRIDLTLECIRRYYIGEASPLSEVLRRYEDFFALFEDFNGYVDFFLLNDLIENGSINFMLPFDNFQRDGYPLDVAEYQEYMRATMKLLRRRNRRINLSLPTVVTR
ncbi:hypothetical protein C1J05_03315 [Sulfitobacter sp. JL08]|uniref:DUF6994 family protein n=1 Tax=Sulfitobacter sp. JL08 TaxID=2070369 RepID=UPI000E0B99AC|nr:hypothetical protein [Sulfitobacter sp. JL08]AXI53665.1 hypothetical protein C1J05_03315 [Sulfitobacter sp. JL08]